MIMGRTFLVIAAMAATGGCAIDNSTYVSPGSAASAVSTVSLADKTAIDATLDAVYAVISGPVGQPRDFDAMRAMFTDDARLYAVGPNGTMGGGTLDDYIERSGPFLVNNGFTETALVNRIEVYGDVAHAWSSYAGTFTQNGEPGSVRGINSFQLHRQADGRWLIHSIFWQAERPGLPLPADMEAM